MIDDAPHNPELSNVVERNMRTILQLRAKYAQNRNLQDRLVDAITERSGRLSFVHLHHLVRHLDSASDHLIVTPMVCSPLSFR